MTDKICRVYQLSDQTICTTCGLEWDTNDPEPPECPRKNEPSPWPVDADFED